MNDPIIEINDLAYTYPDGSTGLDGISLTIRKKDFIILAGRNGSGKSTLLRHLNALIPSPRVKVCHRITQRHIRETRKSVGMVFQDADTQIVSDSVYDDVAFGLENLKVPRPVIRDKVTRQLDAFGMLPLRHKHPASLSGGEKRKLALAGILVMNPDILVFDEPFSNLDYPAVQILTDLIGTLHQEGHTIIMATHDIEPVLSRANRMIIMENGTIAEDGSPADLLHRLEPLGIRKPGRAAV